MNSSPSPPPPLGLLVVARYKEDLTWLETLLASVNQHQQEPQLPPHAVYVYNKGGYDPCLDRLAALGVHIRSLPNIGREGDTFLTHIIDEYDNPNLPERLPPTTGFVNKRKQ